MDSAEEKKGISRRDFLKNILVAGGAAAMGVDVSPVSAQEDGGKENPQIPRAEVPLEDILVDPVKYIEQISGRLEGKLGYAGTRDFLNNFSPELSEDPDKAKHNLEVLHHGFVELGYGQRIVDLLGRSIAITNGGNRDLDKIGHFGVHQSTRMITDLSMPFEVLVNHTDTSNMVFVNDSMQNLVTWLEPMMEEDTDKAREIYRQRAMEFADETSVERGVDRALEFVNRARRHNMLEDEGIDPDSPEVYKDLRLIIDAETEVFPLVNLNSTTISPFENSVRAGFNTRDRSIDIGNDLYNFQNNPNEISINWILTTLLHEQSHSFDPTADFNSMLPYLEPEAFFDYAQGYVESFEEYYYGVKSLSPQELEQLVLDPEHVMEVGVDQLKTEDDIKQFEKEIDYIIAVAEYAQTTEGQRMVRETGMEYFFAENGQETLIQKFAEEENIGRLFKLWDATGVEGWNVLWTHQQNQVGINGVDKFEHLGKVTPQHLEELKKIARQSFENLPENNLEEVVLKMKSVYFMAAFAFMQHVNDVEPFERGSDLYYNNLNVSAFVDDAFVHMHTGPVGEYMYRNGVDWWLDKDPVEQVDEAMGIVEHNARQPAREAAQELGIDDYYSERQTGVINNIYEKAAWLQIKRARLWQAEDPEGAYADFYNSVAEKVFDN